MNASKTRSTLGRGISRLDKQASPMMEAQQGTPSKGTEPLIRKRSTRSQGTTGRHEAIVSDRDDHIETCSPRDQTISETQNLVTETDEALDSEGLTDFQGDQSPGIGIHNSRSPGNMMNILALSTLLWAPVACFLCWTC